MRLNEIDDALLQAKQDLELSQKAREDIELNMEKSEGILLTLEAKLNEIMTSKTIQATA